MTIQELKAKASLIQAKQDACPGHLWQVDTMGRIKHGSGSCVCILCGCRVSLDEADKQGQYYYEKGKY